MALSFLEVIEKINIHHDPKTGRFAPAPGGAKANKFELKTTVTNVVGEETFIETTAYSGGKVAGNLKYSEYDGIPHIQYVETADDFKRQGVATELLQNLQREYPDKEIDFGYTTPDGTKLLEAITYEVKNKQVATDKEKLAGMKKELAETEKKLDKLYDAPELTAKQEKELKQLGDKWDTLYDGIRDLEGSLAGKKETMRFVKLDNVKKSVTFLDTVKKFNPYHGPDGRFTTAGGAASFTYRTKNPKMQGAVNMAVEREKERTAEDEPEQKRKTAIKVAEDKIRNQKHETAIVIDDNGNQIMSKDGTADKVRFSYSEFEKMKGCTVTHNHPNKTILSDADVEMFVKYKLREVRATNSDGKTYSLRRPDGYDYDSPISELESGFIGIFDANMRNAERVAKRTLDMNGYGEKLSKGEISQDEANTKFRKIMSSAMHTYMEKNAKTFGFEYELEG